MNPIKKMREKWQTREELLKIELDLANVTDFLTEADKEQLLKKVKHPRRRALLKVQRASEKNMIKASAERGFMAMVRNYLNTKCNMKSKKVRSLFTANETTVNVLCDKRFKDLFMKKAGYGNGSYVLRALMIKYIRGDFDNEM